MNAVNQLINTALKHIEANQLARAFECLEAASREAEEVRDLNLLWGMYYLRKGDALAAMAALEKEVRYCPDNQLALDLLSELRQAIGAVVVPHGPAIQHDSLGGKLVRAFSSSRVKTRVLEIVSKLRADGALDQEVARYSYAAANSSCWYDAATALSWIVSTLKPATYLEFGVRSGRSIAQVAVQSPTTKVYGLRNWSHQDGTSGREQGAESRGPDFIYEELSRLGVAGKPTLIDGDYRKDLSQTLADARVPENFDLMFINGSHSLGDAQAALATAFSFLAPGGILVVEGIYSQLELGRVWNECKGQHPGIIFLDSRYHLGTGIAINPPFDRIERILDKSDLELSSAQAKKLKLLMPYSVKRDFGKITLPEWLKDSLRTYYSNEVEVIACGPGNEIEIPDGPDFYQRVAPLVQQFGIDAILDVEGGADSLDFMFKRFPDTISVPKVFWAIDTHQYLDLQSEKAKHFDIVYSAQKNAVSSLGANARWLPAGASMHEVDLVRERSISVAFVGSLTPAHARRRKVVEFLSQKLPEFYQHSNVFLDEKAELLSRVKIAVNVSLNNDINFRVFETMATGAMLLTDRITGNGMEDLFVEGEHYVAFDSEEDLLGKIEFYLAHPAEREKIARAGQQLVDSKYRHFHLLRQVIDDIRNALPQQVQVTKHEVKQGEQRACWCGGTLQRSVHPLYSQCESCHTQVLDKVYTDEELKKFYSAQGYWHDRQVQVFNFPPIEERANNDFKDRIPVWFDMLNRFKKAPQRLLEIGCAHGGFLHYCRERGAQHIVGVEVDEGTCQFARKRFNIEHVVSGLFPKVSLPFESFDAITGFDVIEHFLDPVEGLRGVADKLADDGICFFQTPCYRGEGGDWVQFKPAEHTFLYTEKSIRKLFEKVGLEVIEIYPGYFRDDMFVIGRKKSVRKRVALVRTDAIGDNVLATALVAPIARKYGTKVTVICTEASAPLYERHPDVERVVSFNRHQLLTDTDYTAEVERALAALNLDIAINSVYSRDLVADFVSFACNTKETIALQGDLANIDELWRSKNNRLYSRIIQTSDQHLPEVARHEEVLRALAVASPEVVPVIGLEESERVVADRILSEHGITPDRVMVLGAMSSFKAKDYPYWAEALIDVVQEQGLSVVAVGSEKDRQVSQEILGLLKVPTLNLCGVTTLMQSAAIISRAHIVVAADTSIPHIASALGIPNVVVLGGGHFGRFFPYSRSTSIVCLPLECYGCGWRCPYSTEHCVKNVAPQVVAEAIRVTLSGVGAKPRVFVQSSSVNTMGHQSSMPRWKLFNEWLNPESVEMIMVGLVRPSNRVFPILEVLSGPEQVSRVT
jgi:ADP-heptose:LPS heptosyltransferase/2-polyprenyl-3-methyl-5-hydroxy-6-metoxy-1,4-benzoquinol methylase/predicted O-methyltransferase YrrM